MGIKNLYKIIKEHAPAAIDIVPVSDLSGWRIGVDASISVYQWCSIGKTRKITNTHGKYINHIQGAFFRTLSMILADIKPIYIFDGKPPAEKTEVITRRKELRNAGKSIIVPREVFTEVAKLLELMGVPSMQAVSEAEAQAAYLTTIDIIDAVSTEDMDVLTFNGRRLIRGLDTSAKSVVVIETAKVLTGLELTRDQFVDLCILLGCDYSTTLPGIGYKRAFALIKKYRTIENIIEAESIIIPPGFDYVSARREFTAHKVSKYQQDIELRILTQDDIDRLRNFLVNEHGLESNRVERSLNKLAKHYNV